MVDSFFCINQKTAYDMRISDWSSDVCSSDLYHPRMPELPEVETTRRGIATIMPGHVLERFVVYEPRMRWPIPADLPDRINGRQVISCERRGKRSEEHTSELQSLMRIS